MASYEIVILDLPDKDPNKEQPKLSMRVLLESDLQRALAHPM
jgi:hypothetical protein